MRVEPLKYFLILVVILFATISARAQNSVEDTLQKKLSSAENSGDRTKHRVTNFSQTDLIRIARKYVVIWHAIEDRKYMERIFKMDHFGEELLTLMIGRLYLRQHPDNVKKMLRLIKELEDGDSVSANLLGFLLYKSGKELLEMQQPMDRPEPDTIALLLAARHFGVAKAATLLHSRYYLFSDEFFETSNHRSQEYIRNPLLLLDLPSTR